MIRFEDVSFSYDGAEEATLSGVELVIPEGELCVVIGRSGSGKSTLLKCVNGLAPRFTGGELQGRVLTDGYDTCTRDTKEFAGLVGYVGQDPSASFVAETVEQELVYGMEQLCIEPNIMRPRVEAVIDLLGLDRLRARRLTELSGGEQQRVAIGAVLTSHPRILVLDEPTSALDPGAAEDVLAVLSRLVEDFGLTVLLAEHRLERVLQFSDRVIVVGRGGQVTAAEPAQAMEFAPLAPPVVELGRAAGWRPLPITVRAARRLARQDPRLVDFEPEPMGPAVAAEPAPVVVRTSKLTMKYRDVVALREVDLAVRDQSVTTLMGRNGSGKSTLMWTLQGARRPTSGRVDVDGSDPAGMSAARARRRIALVPQNPSDLLYLPTVADECRQADRESQRPPGTCESLLVGVLPGVDAGQHPLDLSEGQRLALALAVQLTGSPKVLLLDEPTRGLDYPAKHRLAELLRGIVADPDAPTTCVMIATHDVEFAAAVSDSIVVLSDGEIISQGDPGTILTQSPLFTPQLARVLEGRALTLADVAAPLDGAAR